MTSQLLAARILALLGLSATALSGACSDDGTSSGSSSNSCGETQEVEPIEGCTITLNPGDTITDVCILSGVNGACPSIEAINADDLLGGTAVCGVLPQGAAAGGAGGMGGAATGGMGGAGGTGGMGGAAAGGMAGVGGAGGDDGGKIQCCYPVVRNDGCPGGRPFLVDGQARTASDGTTGKGWQSPGATALGADVPAEVRRAIALDWVSDGRMEHASVAAFAKFALELMALGAPFDLVRDTQRAMADEIVHAARCFELAAAYGEAGVVLGPLDFGVIRADASLASVLKSTILEGCIGETVAATMAANASVGALEPVTAAVLSEIAEDESRHSELAWRFVAWVLANHPELHGVVRSTFDQAIADLLESAERPSEHEAHAELFKAHGRLSTSAKRAATRAAVLDVIKPCSSALLASTAPSGASKTESTASTAV